MIRSITISQSKKDRVVKETRKLRRKTHVYKVFSQSIIFILLLDGRTYVGGRKKNEKK